MKRLEVSGAVRPIYASLGLKGLLIKCSGQRFLCLPNFGLFNNIRYFAPWLFLFRKSPNIFPQSCPSFHYHYTENTIRI